MIVSNFHADGETVIACMRAGANDFLLQPLKRTEFRDAMARLERAPKRGTPVRKQTGQDLHLHRHQRRRGHHHPRRQFRRGPGPAQTIHGPDRSRLDRQRRRHAARRRAAIHPRSKWPRTWSAWTRRSSKASSRAIRWASFWSARRSRSEQRGHFHRTHVPRVRHLPGGKIRCRRDRRRARRHDEVVLAAARFRRPFSW